MDTHIHTYERTYKYIFLHTPIPIHTQNTYTNTHIHTQTYEHMLTHSHINTHIHAEYIFVQVMYHIEFQGPWLQ